MTVALVQLTPLAIVAGPWELPPGTISVPGIRVDSPPIGWTDGTFSLCTVNYTGAKPTEHHTLATTTLSLSDSTLTITQSWTPPSLARIKAVLKERLESEATFRWVKVRGANASGIEDALATGIVNVDAATSVLSAISAYQAVTFP